MRTSTWVSACAWACMISAANSEGVISADNLISIAPETGSCDGAPFLSECVTAVTAAPYIDLSFLNHGIKGFNTQAAVVAVMLFESGNLKYNINHYPGVPGQGTRNMQSPSFNLKYATFLSTACTNCGISTADVERATREGPTAVLALVNGMQFSIGSAAWFLKTQCESSIMDGLAAGTEIGWTSYIEQCLGTTVTEERTAGWNKVMSLGRWS
ncbi:uncharacterized protein RCC_08585 [Ramularia collo-cygni]|uniref:Uncharacterized protein n=1 Tax=Ramularia collo-cygni TaxID=112498 RepID=A0A2D3VI50_9PEZI|nr:uncharacterized protein RCC_08585 [Ramularia collo-cygni]CZT22879.1 uncharacterized protein RCC_08585 [Ramularia collo-cygni]